MQQGEGRAQGDEGSVCMALGLQDIGRVKDTGPQGSTVGTGRARVNPRRGRKETKKVMNPIHKQKAQVVNQQNQEQAPEKAQ